jgi:hypothetical protein
MAADRGTPARSRLRTPNWRPVSMKDMTQATPGFLQPLVLGELGDQHLFKGCSKRKRPAVLILGRAPIEPDAPAVPIDLSPLDRQDLVLNAPASEIGKRHDRPRVLYATVDFSLVQTE